MSYLTVFRISVALLGAGFPGSDLSRWRGRELEPRGRKGSGVGGVDILLPLRPKLILRYCGGSTKEVRVLLLCVFSGVIY